MKRALAALLCLVLLPCACGTSDDVPTPAPLPEAEGLRIAVASDLHFDPDNTNKKAGLGAVAYNPELIDALLFDAAAQGAEVLLLTGDLVNLGKREHHEALAEKLRALEGEGVPVYVLPGNHDLDNPGSAAFSGDGYSLVPSATAEDFRRIYADFGFDEALGLDGDSLSYTAQLDGETRLLMLDFNTAHDPCGVSEKTLRWVEQELRAAQEEGLRVLAAGHQNLFQQTVFTSSYVIRGAGELAALLRQYGVRLFLSGHLHCQHWRTEQGLTEIATGALSVSPCQYGVLTLTEDRLHYETRETDVSAWAQGEGRTEAALLDFPRYARDYFDARNRRSTSEMLSLLGYTDAEVERMTQYLVELNRAYFSGDLRKAAALDPEGDVYALYARFPTLYTPYLDSARADFGRDFRVWDSAEQ